MKVPTTTNHRTWREPLAIGVGAGLMAGFLMGLNVARHGQDWLFRNDAEFFWVVARDPFGRGAMFRPVAAVTGNAYRFGRPLYPLLAYLMAFGHPGAVRWTMMAVDVMAFGGMVGLAAELLRRCSRPPIGALAILLLPGVWWAVVIVISEPLVMAIMLATYLLYLDGRRRQALVMAALLLLARESAGLALVPMAWMDWKKAGKGGLVGWAATTMPLLAWWTWVQFRVGQWPFLDPSVSRREALDLPLRGYLRVAGGLHPGHIAVFALVALTILGSFWVSRYRSWFPVSQGGVLMAVLMLFLGPNATRFPGEVLRLLVPADVLIVLALVGPGGHALASANDV